MPVESIIALIQVLAGFAPQIEEITRAVETAVTLLRSGAAPTPEQMATIDVALEAANAAVQDA